MSPASSVFQKIAALHGCVVPMFVMVEPSCAQPVGGALKLMLSSIKRMATSTTSPAAEPVGK
jgi:hypothetical protein